MESKKFQEIEEKFPSWIICTLEDYSDDYEYLRENWKNICIMIGKSRKKILIVKDTHSKLMSNLCEELVTEGYIVREFDEFIPCEVCRKAIPTENVWKTMMEYQLPVPPIWSYKCKKC